MLGRLYPFPEVLVCENGVALCFYRAGLAAICSYSPQRIPIVPYVKTDVESLRLSESEASVASQALRYDL